MRPLRTALALLAALLLSSLALAADPTWRDSTRDVYVDGRLERGAQVLSADSGKRLALLLPGAKKALVLDCDASTFSVVPRKAFRVAADGASAEIAADATMKPAGTFQKVDGSTSIVAWKGRTVLVSRHQGLVGDVSEPTLFSAVPVWRGLMETYQPVPAAVAALAKETRPVTMTVVLGTWCGDSKEFVPRVLKSVRAAANPNLSVRLVALDNDFLQPQDVIGGRRIINVPTIVLESDGRELGRITETPAGATMEEDLAAILSGKQPEHEGRYERGPEVARGTYLYRDALGKRGEERWTIFSRKDGGRLVRSRIDTGDLVVEVFQGTDADGKLRFAEITKRQGEAVHRARFFVDGSKLTGRLRGREAGILQQDLVLPPSFAFASPAIAASGWMGLAAAAGPTSQLVCYVAPSGFDSPLGTTCVETHRVGGEEAITVPAGEFRATRLARQSAAEASDWWIHPDLGIPVRGQIVGGMEYVLSSLVVQ
ncbi:MAG: thioredoxin family protein [Acidobacteriota bacterium]|nr:thioredoxin family protein [Acidobacteriota bacterium]